MKKFYIIANSRKTMGIGAMVCENMKYFMYALDRGLTPIVDYKHYYNQYFKDNRAYKDNAWEYFFKQPCGFGLEDITDEDSVEISWEYSSELPKYDIIKRDFFPSTPSEEVVPILQKTKTLFKTCINFSNELSKSVEEFYRNIKNGDKIVLGVLVRGTDYLTRRSFGEPMQPSPNAVINKVKEYLSKYPEITHIYLATEDSGIYNMFKNTFGEILLDNNQYRYESYSKDSPLLAEVETSMENSNYNLSKDYLTSLYLLSKCDYFVGGFTAGTRVAWLMQNSWKDFYVYKLGRYGKTFKERLFSRTMKRKNGCDIRIYQILGIPFRKKLKSKTKIS